MLNAFDGGWSYIPWAGEGQGCAALKGKRLREADGEKAIKRTYPRDELLNEREGEQEKVVM